MPFTTNEIADKLGMDRQIVYGLIRFLEETKLLAHVSERKRPDGKGKPAREYDIPSDICMKLKDVLEKVR